MKNLKQKISSVLRSSKSGLAGLAAGAIIAAGCEKMRWEGDDVYVPIANAPMQMYHCWEVLSTLENNTLYDVVIEGENIGGIEEISVYGSYNVHYENGSNIRFAYKSEPTNSAEGIQYSPSFRMRVGQPEGHNPASIGFIVGIESSDGGSGFWPKQFHFSKVAE